MSLDNYDIALECYRAEGMPGHLARRDRQWTMSKTEALAS